jgi:hypothetical protein
MSTRKVEALKAKVGDLIRADNCSLESKDKFYLVLSIIGSRQHDMYNGPVELYWVWSTYDNRKLLCSSTYIIDLLST